MTSAPRVSILGLNQYNRVINDPDSRTKPHCHKCHKRLAVGDPIAIKKAGRYTSWYHVECAKKVNLI